MMNIDRIITESINSLITEKSKIHIKKKNRGKFTATKKKTGKSTEELTHSKNPLTRKRAIFAQNAKKWHHKGNKKRVNEAVKNLLSEAKMGNWNPDEFVTWEEYQNYCNHGYDWIEKNEARCDKLGVPKENRCDSCQRELKGTYYTLYVDTSTGNSRFYANQIPGSEPVKIGNSCMKAFEKAHFDKYGH